MVDKKAVSNERTAVWWLPANGLANPEAPTVAELTAALRISKGIAFEGYDFAVSDSEQNDDRGLEDPATAQSRGFAQFGGSMSFFWPHDLDDTTSDFAANFAAFQTVWTVGYVVTRVAEKRADEPVTAGDFVSIYRVMSDAFTPDTEGGDAYKFSINFLAQGDLYTFAIVRGPSLTAVTVAASTTTIADGEYGTAVATLLGNNITQGAEWSSSDSSILTVTQNGVYFKTGDATGSATITASHPSGTTSTGTAITVS